MSNIEKIKKFDEQMQLLEKDVSFLEWVFEKMKEIEERYQTLSDYYYSEWMEDYEKEKDLQVWILSEDWLWNLFHEKEEIEKEILKYLVKKL